MPSRVQGISNVILISSNGDTTLALKNDGSMWGWGSNYYGHLGDGTNIEFRASPAEVARGINTDDKDTDTSITPTTGISVDPYIDNDGLIKAIGILIILLLIIGVVYTRIKR